MKTIAISCVLTLSLVTVQWSEAQPRVLPPVEVNEVAVKEKEKKKDKDKDKDKKPEPPKVDFFPPITSAVGDFPGLFNPQMMGHMPPLLFARRNLFMQGTQTIQTTTVPLNPGNPTTVTTVTTPTGQTRTVLVPVPTRGAFNVMENESPRPQDRIFAFWNYYNGIGFGNSGQNADQGFTTTTVAPRVIRNQPAIVTTQTNTVLPGAQRVELNREVFGFEKTFLGGDASIEVRGVANHMGGGGANFGVNSFGDLTIIGKYALINNRDTGKVVSTGLALTVPTGRSIATTDGNFHDTLFQPYVGYICPFDRFFLQGFHSIVIPTDRNDVTLVFNSVGLNYWLYRGSPDRLISFVVPTVEGHLTTPLNHRDFAGPLVVPDTMVLTTGVHLGIFRNTTLSIGAATPVTTPRVFNVEGFVQLNVRF